MAFPFQYHRVDDFGLGLDVAQLHDEVEAVLGTLEYINTGEDLSGGEDRNGVVLSFSANISKTTLDGIVAVHVPTDKRARITGSRANPEEALKRLLDLLETEGVLKNDSTV